jgi:hypothetical protein
MIALLQVAYTSLKKSLLTSVSLEVENMIFSLVILFVYSPHRRLCRPSVLSLVVVRRIPFIKEEKTPILAEVLLLIRMLLRVAVVGDLMPPKGATRSCLPIKMTEGMSESSTGDDDEAHVHSEKSFHLDDSRCCCCCC